MCRVVDNNDFRPALRPSNGGDRCRKIEERWERRYDARAMDTLPHAQCRQTAGTRSVCGDLASRAPRQHDKCINAVIDEGTSCNIGKRIQPDDEMYCRNVCSNQSDKLT